VSQDQPSWSVPYGREPWLAPRVPGAAESKDERAQLSIGAVIGRAQHAFEAATPGADVQARAGSYVAAATEQGVVFSPTRPSAERRGSSMGGDPETRLRLRTAAVRAGGAVVAGGAVQDRIAIGNTVQALLGAGIVEHVEADSLACGSPGRSQSAWARATCRSRLPSTA